MFIERGCARAAVLSLTRRLGGADRRVNPAPKQEESWSPCCTTSASAAAC